MLTVLDQSGAGASPACRGRDDPAQCRQDACAPGTGWTLQPDARHSVFFEITGISDTTSQIPSTSKGPTWYFIIPPVGVDKEPQGTPATAALDLGTHAYPSLYLAFHYRYVTPMAGVYVTTKQNPNLKQDGVYGAQLKGQNHQGQYQAWHRMYNPVTARWTTPDPAAAPWTNLVSYVGDNPINRSDPTGLQGNGAAGGGEQRDVAPTSALIDDVTPDQVPGANFDVPELPPNEGNRVRFSSKDEVASGVTV